ncbi:unknown [Candidatus Apopatosoma intestinale]|nr:unknown [Candidatus Apopatosoma intestinale]
MLATAPYLITVVEIAAGLRRCGMLCCGEPDISCGNELFAVPFAALHDEKSYFCHILGSDI